jgi:hypothetical protein
MILTTLILISTQVWAKDNRLANAEALMMADPIRAYELALTADDSNEKYKFLYSVDTEIAKRTPPPAAGQGIYSQYVRENPRRFELNGEAGNEFYYSSDYWLKKTNAKASQIGEFEFDRITYAHQLYNGGKRSPAHQHVIFSRYAEWLKKYPRHVQSSTAMGRMRGLQSPQ